MSSSLVDETMTASHHLNYPLYLEKFSELYIKVKDESLNFENSTLLNAAYYFAIFSHALNNKSFLLAFDFLNEVNQSLNERILNAETESNLSEPLNKLYKFTCNLQKQYDEFLERKKLKSKK